MTVEYKDGNRITALSTDLLPTNPQDGMVVEFTDTGAIGYRINGQWQVPSAWEFLGSKKLSAEEDSIDVSLSDDKIRDNYQVLGYFDNNGAISTAYRFNDQSGTDYSYTLSRNGATDTPSTAQTMLRIDTSTRSYPHFVNYEVSNILNQEKLVSSHVVMQNTATAANAPDRSEMGGKIAYSPRIKKFTVTNEGTGGYVANSELITLGQSPNVTVPENRRFWKQIAFSEVRGTDDRIVASWEGDYDYLWMIGYINSGTSTNFILILNGDEGNNYNNRKVTNGTGEAIGQRSDIDLGNGVAGENHFVSTIMVNKTTEEKLGLSEAIHNNGNGSDLAPTRKENAWKHAQTTNKTKQVELRGDASNGTMEEGSFIQVYGGNALW